MAVVEIKLEQLKIHPKNIRKEYEGIDELAQSIKENGIMQNLTVVPDPNEKGMYFVVIGNRRLTAARQAGIETAPCLIVDEMSDKDQVTTMLTENMNRKDLKIYEEAAAMQMCFADFGVAVEELEKKTGLSKTTINHRLNVAKLDEKVLKKKASDEEFQLSLTDLYALEKVEDVKTRNKILKEASDSRDLANMARRAAKEELEKKNLKEFVELFKKKGIKKAPKEADNEFYSGKWDKIVDYELAGKVPKQLKTGGKDGMMYVVRYSRVYIIRKAEKKKRELSEYEIQQKEKQKKSKELKAKYRAILDDMMDFARNIFDGKIKGVKDTEGIVKVLWEIMLEDSSWIRRADITSVVLGKDIYGKNVTDEEKNAAEEKGKNLPIIYQQLALTLWKLKDKDIVAYDGQYKKATGDLLKKMYDVLALYGYSWADDESRKVAVGEHDLFEKKEEVA